MSNSPHAPIVEGVVVVVRRGERFLVIRRAPHVIAPGAWCFVGGAILPGESQPDAVVREFREEVSGQVRPVACVWQYEQPDGGLRLYWWLADLLDGSLRANPNEVAELRWCDWQEIRALPGLLASNVQFLDAIGEAWDSRPVSRGQEPGSGGISR